MDVVSRRISLTAWGRLYGFDKATTARMHHAGKLPPELQIERLPNGRYYVVVPSENDGRCVVYARVSSSDQKEDLDRQVGRVVEWATQQGYRPDEVVKEIGSDLNGNRRRLRRLVSDHTVGTIVVEHRERLSRFGFEYVEAALAGRGARILVMDEGELEDDLVRDVTEVMTSAVRSALRTAFGPASGGTSVGGGTGRLMQQPGTYQTRVSGYAGLDRSAGDAVLAAYGELYGRVQRKLFAEVAAGRSATSLKCAYLERYGIPARMFNAVRVSLDGKMSSVRESQRLQQDSLQRRVVRAERQVSDAAERGRWDQVHQKKRRLGNLRNQLVGLEADITEGLVRLCFGSKRLWRKQHHLELNGYASREEWLKEWQDARSNEFFVLGSRDETAGCQLCVATVADDGTLTLRLRLPDCLANQHGKYLFIQGVRFAYGHEQVLAALASNAEYVAYRREHGEHAARATELGQAISYRFKRDGKGWRVFATTQMMVVPVVTDRRRGAVGVDLNADHLAVAETDASGSCINAWRVPLVTYGKNTRQAEAIIGDAVAGVVEYAREVGKPIVIERLDFRQKKAALEGESPRYSRMLSSFSYGKVKAYFISRGYRQGVEVHQVNPAFSSVIGRVKFMERYGLSVHQAAALVLARRSLGFSERIPRRLVCPVGNGVHIAFTVPARKRVKHVWTYWGVISGQLRPALAAQHRLGKRRRRSNPVQAVVRAEARGVA